MNPEAMGLYVFEDDDLTSDDIVIPSEPCLKAFDMDTFLKNSKTDRETNTDCGFFVQPSGTPRGSNGLGLGTRPRVKEVVKRYVIISIILSHLFFAIRILQNGDLFIKNRTRTVVKLLLY
jgi:hypothetical protein